MEDSLHNILDSSKLFDRVDVRFFWKTLMVDHEKSINVTIFPNFKIILEYKNEVTIYPIGFPTNCDGMQRFDENLILEITKWESQSSRIYFVSNFVKHASEIPEEYRPIFGKLDQELTEHQNVNILRYACTTALLRIIQALNSVHWNNPNLIANIYGEKFHVHCKNREKCYEYHEIHPFNGRKFGHWGTLLACEIIRGHASTEKTKNMLCTTRCVDLSDPSINLRSFVPLIIKCGPTTSRTDDSVQKKSDEIVKKCKTKDCAVSKQSSQEKYKTAQDILFDQINKFKNSR